MNCPRCKSPDPVRHPAMQFEGEVQLCSDSFHEPATIEFLKRQKQFKEQTKLSSGEQTDACRN